MCREDVETKSILFGWERALPGRGDLPGFLQGMDPGSSQRFPAEIKAFHAAGHPRSVHLCVFTCLSSRSAWEPG